MAQGITCVQPDQSRYEFGFGEGFTSRLREFVGNITKKKARNALRNLGIDDVRGLEVEYTTRSGNTRKFFGINRAEIDEYNALKAEGKELSSGVIVKVPRADGNDEFFISNKSTDTAPSRWEVINDKLRRNTDWDRVGKNVTLDESGAPRLFVEDNGVYRLPDEGEQGEVFLNIQKPIKGDKQLTKHEIADRGIDAYEVAPNTYKVIDEDTQVIEPSRAGERQTFDSMEKNTELLDEPLQEEVAEQMKGLGYGGRAALGVAGAVTGEMVDAEDGDGFWWGGALGFMLGTPKAVNKMKGYYHLTTGGKDAYDKFKNSLKEQEEYYNKVREDAVEFGYSGDPSDRTRFQKFRDAVSNPIRKALREGKEWKDIILRNQYFESAKNFFFRMPSPTAKELIKKVAGLETAPNIMFAVYGKHADRVFGKQGVRKINDVQKQFVDNYYGRDVPAEKARDSFGSAIHRIRTYEAEIVDGQFRYNTSNQAAQAIYRNSEELQEFDRAILESEQGQQVLDVVRSTFEEQADMVIDAKLKRFNRYAENVSPKYQSLLQRLRESGLDSSQFERYLSENNPESFKLLKKATTKNDGLENGRPTYDKSFDKALQIHDDVVRFDELYDNYMPQMVNFDKSGRVKQRFMDNFEIDGRPLREFSTKRQEEEWRRHVGIMIQRLNKDADRYLEKTADGADYTTKYFGSYGDAADKLQEIATNMLDRTERGLVLNAMNNGNTDQFIKSIVDGDGKEKFYLTTPESYKEQGIDLYRESNIHDLGKAYSMYISKTAAVQSNFLDRPRRFNLPTTMLETDIDTIMRKYAQDAGPRLHMIRERISDVEELNAYFGTISKELSDKVDDPNVVEENLERIKEWYNNMAGINSPFEVGKSLQERLQLKRNNIKTRKISSMLRNFAGSPFFYFTTSYSPFTPLVMGPFLASWGNVLKTYKHYVFNPKDLRKVTDEMEKRGVIDRSLQSYRAEMGDQWGKDMMPNSESSRLDRWHRMSKRFAHGSAGLSLTKPMLSKLGVDYENTGLLRLFTGNMFDISGAESGLMTMAVLREIEEWVEIGNKIKKGTYEGSKRMGDIRRNLEKFGVTDVDDFLTQKDKVNKFVRALDGAEDVKIDDLPDTFNEQMTKIMDSTVNQYHGRTKLSRPLSWTNNPYGRLLSQFSVYAQNFSVQTIGDRIYRPIKDWNDRYATSKEVPAMKIAWWAGTGNDQKMKELFSNPDGTPRINEQTGRELWKDAYDEFPVQAYSNFFKVFGAIGVGKAMMLYRDGLMDIVEMAINESLGIDDYEAWRSINKEWTVNPEAPEEDQFTFAEIFNDDVDGWTKFSLFRHMLYEGVELGFGARQAQLAITESRYTQGGLASKFPMGSLAQNAYESLGKIAHSPLEDMPRTAGKQLLGDALLYTPAIGTFNNSLNNALQNIVFNKPKNRETVNSWVDSETGLPLQNMEYNGW